MADDGHARRVLLSSHPAGRKTKAQRPPGRHSLRHPRQCPPSPCCCSLWSFLLNFKNVCRYMTWFRGILRASSYLVPDLRGKHSFLQNLPSVSEQRSSQGGRRLIPASEAWGGPSRRSRRAGHPLAFRQEPQIPATLALGSTFPCEGRGHVAGAAGRCRSAGLPVLTGSPRHLVCGPRCPCPGGAFSLQLFPTFWERPARTGSVGEMPWEL